MGDGVSDVVAPSRGLSLCAGAGGLDLGIMLAEPDFHTICWVEREPHAVAAIVAGQAAGYFRPAPVWGDLRTFVGDGWRGHVDTILAGYPCQPFSAAGQRRGSSDPRHLWPDVLRIIAEVAPRWVFLENVEGHISLGLDAVLRDLCRLGYAVAPRICSSREVGGAHQRKRIFIVAYRDPDADAGRMGRRGDQCGEGEGENWSEERERIWPRAWCGCGHVAHADGGGTGAERERRGGEQRFQPESGGDVGDAERRRRAQDDVAQHPRLEPADRQLPLAPPGPHDAAGWAAVLDTARELAPAVSMAEVFAWWRDCEAADPQRSPPEAQPGVRRMVDGMAARSRALQLLGNGVHPLAAAAAWRAGAAAHALAPVDMDGGDAAARADANVS